MTTRQDGPPLDPNKDWRPKGWPNVKLVAGDCEIVARKLGEIAARIDQRRPARAAKELIKAAGDDGMKQHRLFIFPENAEKKGKKRGPAKSPDSLYEEPLDRNARRYHLLVKAAYEREHENATWSSESHACRLYEDRAFRGTTRSPQRTRSAGDQTIEQIAARYFKGLSAVVEDTGLAAVWQRLAKQPFDKDYSFDDDGEERWRFSAVKSPDGTIREWASPKVFLGQLAYPVTVEAIPIPAELRGEFLSSAFIRETDDDGDEIIKFSSSAAAWMKQIGWSCEDCGWQGEAAMPCSEVELYGAFDLWLSLEENGEGGAQPKLSWNILDSDTVDHRVWDFERSRAMGFLQSENDTLISTQEIGIQDGCQDERIGLLWDYKRDAPTHVLVEWFCLRQEFYGFFSILDLSQELSELNAELVSEHPFLAKFDTASNRPLPVPSDSLICALLLNTAAENADNRVASMFKSLCEKIVIEAKQQFELLDANADELLDGM